VAAKSAGFVTESAGIARQDQAVFHENAALGPERVAFDPVPIPAGGGLISRSGPGPPDPHRMASGGHARGRSPACGHVRGPSDGHVRLCHDHHPSSPRSSAARHDAAPPSVHRRTPDESSIPRAIGSGCHWGTNSRLSTNSPGQGFEAALS
jgi:hypothetical protein